MTLHILGAGSIGILYASWMRRTVQEFPLCLLLQSHHSSKISAAPPPRLGGACSGADVNVGCITTKLIDVHGNALMQHVPSEIISKGNGTGTGTGTGESFIQNILLTTKAPQAVNALESIFHRFHPTEKVNLIVMTNGCLAVVDGINESLMKNGLEHRVKIICASTTHGAMRGILNEHDLETSPLQVIHTGLGHTFIEDDGPGHENADANTSLQKTLNKIWNDAGLRSTIVSHDDMYVMNWKKLATNCAINPLTALRNCRNGELLSEESWSKQEIDLDYTNPTIFNQLIQEVSNVALADAEKKGFKIDDINNQPSRSSGIRELEYDRLLPFVKSVVQNTARNKSSMLQDILSKRYPTEVMYLNGYVARLGRDRYGIDVPANAYVTKEVERISRI